MRSAGTSPRHATHPVKRGVSGPKVSSRTRLCMPSAPTSTSASAAAPFSKRAIDAPVPVLDRDQSMPGMRALWRQRGGEQRGEIAAMKMIVRRAERRFDLRAERGALQGAPVIPPPLMDGDRPHTACIHRGAEAETAQQARRIGTDLDAGADLAELRRLLVDVDVAARLHQSERSGETADAAAYHRHAHLDEVNK